MVTTERSHPNGLVCRHERQTGAHCGAHAFNQAFPILEPLVTKDLMALFRQNQIQLGNMDDHEMMNFYLQEQSKTGWYRTELVINLLLYFGVNFRQVNDVQTKLNNTSRTNLNAFAADLIGTAQAVPSNNGDSEPNVITPLLQPSNVQSIIVVGSKANSAHGHWWNLRRLSDGNWILIDSKFAVQRLSLHKLKQRLNEAQIAFVITDAFDELFVRRLESLRRTIHETITALEERSQRRQSKCRSEYRDSNFFHTLV